MKPTDTLDKFFHILYKRKFYRWARIGSFAMLVTCKHYMESELRMFELNFILTPVNERTYELLQTLS